MSRSRIVRCLLILCVLSLALTTAAQTVQIETSTNGYDADAPPGPTIPVGDTVDWSYVVINTGSEPLTNITVTDDQGVAVTCPTTTRAPGEWMVCTASGIVQPGPYANLGTVVAELPDTSLITESDPSHYTGSPLSIRKLTNGVDLDDSYAPALLVGSEVTWTYIVSNRGTGPLTDVLVVDDQIPAGVTCPSTTLAPGEAMTCIATGIAVAGHYLNIGSASADLAGETVTASDYSAYVGRTEIDFGDAPDPAYPTLLASDGARHLLGSGVYLGLCVDAEADGQTAAGADGDDLNTGVTYGTCTTPGDDDDGVTFTSLVVIGREADVEVVVSQYCILSAWIDFNADGDWSDAGEDLFPGGRNLWFGGAHNLTFPVPPDAVPGPTTARFRCTNDGPVGVSGLASDGEVEDHPVSIEVPVVALTATKTDQHLVDVDGDGMVEPGDTLRYTIVIENSGNFDLTGVVLTDPIDYYTHMVVPYSVTSTAGMVLSGYIPGDESVIVAVGDLPAFGGSATITFDIWINSGLDFDMDSLPNQAIVSGDDFADVLTDDPDTPVVGDPTVTPVVVPPDVRATKSAGLEVDVDGDGRVEPGDTLRYGIYVRTRGVTDATEVVFTDTPDPNTTLVPGSVTTTMGSVTSGNTAGDTTVVVDVGTLSSVDWIGWWAMITFDVLIHDAPPLGVTSITNQGLVTGASFDDVLTDDWMTSEWADPTVTPLIYPPDVTATKTAELVRDIDKDDKADGGEVIRYTIAVHNAGRGDAVAVLTDTPDPNTSIVPGSVTTTSGVVTSGNAEGDPIVTVDLGILPGMGGVATIVFDVQLDLMLDPAVGRIRNVATVSGDNFDDVPTDDPSLPGSADATTLPVSHDLTNIPTLDQWTLLLMMALLATVALRRLGAT